MKVIDFTGGEPLLHREIDHLLGIAKEMGFITTLTTNALLYPKWASRLKGLVDMLHFSLDSAVEQKHNDSRGVDCFRFVMESIGIAKSLGERPDILFTVLPQNIHEIEAAWQLAWKDHALMLLLNPVFDYNQVETGGTFTDDQLTEMEKWGKKRGIYRNDAFIKLRREGGNHVNDPVCKAASSTIVISPDNKLVLPCYHLGMEEIEINNELEALYLSDKVQRLVALEGTYEQCEGCAINCYMQPSFAVEMNRFWWKALPSTIKYNLTKGTWKQLL